MYVKIIYMHNDFCNLLIAIVQFDNENSFFSLINWFDFSHRLQVGISPFLSIARFFHIFPFLYLLIFEATTISPNATIPQKLAKTWICIPFYMYLTTWNMPYLYTIVLKMSNYTRILDCNNKYIHYILQI